MGVCSLLCYKQKELPRNVTEIIEQVLGTDQQICEESEENVSKKSIASSTSRDSHCSNSLPEEQSQANEDIFVTGLKKGFGQETFPDGSKYRGEYENGMKHGYGQLIYPDESYYEGEFKFDKIEGHGKYVWGNMRQYEGYWNNNQMHGDGITTWTDGRHYKGTYKDNLKHGYGEYRWYTQYQCRSDGRTYRGFWKCGHQDGEGILTLASGKSKKGKWENGNRIAWL